MKKKATEYFNNGYSCSESIVKAAIDNGLCDKNLLSVSTVFSGGSSSGCMCGAIAGALMVLGYNYGRDNSANNHCSARNFAKEFMEKFKKLHKVTCCKVLSNGLTGVEKKENCSKLVGDSAIILEELIKLKVIV